MRKFFFAMSLAFATISLQAWPTASPSEAADPASQHETISGVVQKVDESGGKVTLEHGPIKSLGMDLGMTMVLPCKIPPSSKDLSPATRCGLSPRRSTASSRS